MCNNVLHTAYCRCEKHLFVCAFHTFFFLLFSMFINSLIWWYSLFDVCCFNLRCNGFVVVVFMRLFLKLISSCLFFLFIVVFYIWWWRWFFRYRIVNPLPCIVLPLDKSTRSLSRQWFVRFFSLRLLSALRILWWNHTEWTFICYGEWCVLLVE